MKICKKAVEERWIDFGKDGVKFLLRPFPASVDVLRTLESKEVTRYGWVKFCYCVMGWEGLIDEDGKPLECNDENKKLLYDYVQDIVIFVGSQTESIANSIVSEIKN